MVSKKSADQTYAYAIVEAALADSVGIAKSDLPAFRAKLRHLRNIGVPKIAKPGRGTRIAYSKRNVTELRLALALESVGNTPRNAAKLAMLAAQEISLARAPHLFLIVHPNHGIRVAVWGDQGTELAHNIHSTTVCAVINVDDIVNSVDLWLAKHDESA